MPVTHRTAKNSLQKYTIHGQVVACQHPIVDKLRGLLIKNSYLCRAKNVRHEHRPQIPRWHPDLLRNPERELCLYRQNRPRLGDDPNEVRLPEPPSQVRQKLADHHAGILFQWAERTLRRAENHGVGDGMGAVSCFTFRSERGKTFARRRCKSGIDQADCPVGASVWAGHDGNLARNAISRTGPTLHAADGQAGGRHHRRV